MSEKKFWYAKAGEKYGSFSQQELKAKALAGDIDDTCLIWAEGFKNWIPATSVKGLLPAKPTSEPPPLPPQNTQSPPPVKQEVKQQTVSNTKLDIHSINIIAKLFILAVIATAAVIGFSLIDGELQKIENRRKSIKEGQEETRRWLDEMKRRTK